jgi:hypothetical protein
MGETGAASADDAGSLFWNPAALGFSSPHERSAGRALYLDAAHDFAAFTRNLNTRGSAGIGLSLLSYDPLETSNIEGSPTGSLEPREWQLLAGYGRRLRGPSWLAGHGWGVGVKWISSTLGDTDQTTALDAGFFVASSGPVAVGDGYHERRPGIEAGRHGRTAPPRTPPRRGLDAELFVDGELRPAVGKRNRSRGGRRG